MNTFSFSTLLCCWLVLPHLDKRVIANADCCGIIVTCNISYNFIPLSVLCDGRNTSMVILVINFEWDGRRRCIPGWGLKVRCWWSQSVWQSFSNLYFGLLFYMIRQIFYRLWLTLNKCEKTGTYSGLRNQCQNRVHKSNNVAANINLTFKQKHKRYQLTV